MPAEKFRPIRLVYSFFYRFLICNLQFSPAGYLHRSVPESLDEKKKKKEKKFSPPRLYREYIKRVLKTGRMKIQEGVKGGGEGAQRTRYPGSFKTRIDMVMKGLHFSN